MKIKSIVIAVLAASTFGAGAATVTNKGMLIELAPLNKSSISTQKTKVKFATLQDKASQNAYFKTIEEHTGKKLYIVRLIDAPVTTYKGGIKGLAASKVVQKRASSNKTKFNAKSSVAMQYAAYLGKQQATFLNKASSEIGSEVVSIKSLKYAINGLITKLTYAEAITLSNMQEVAFVEKNEMLELQTDTGPEFIGAGAVWNGTASSTSSEFKGEGVIVGIIDTGINTDHRSFAATGDDEYTVTNPFGDDVYVGDCVVDASLCNSKLIGVRSYAPVLGYIADNIGAIPALAGVPAPTNGEDYSGHGSHTSSTAAGNVLIDVPLTINDPTQGSAGDGFETSTIFPRVSGVAPHANVISYQTCLPGGRGDTFAGCFSAAGVGAIDDAIADGVDVINYSIGGSTQFSPWTSSTELGFLSAQAAGIFVATSAGNSGPNPSTTTKASPWYTAVAATSHNRTVDFESSFTVDGSEVDSIFSQGPIVPNAGVSGILTYAGAIDAENFEGCLAFSENAFADSIALISRGSCAFTDKIDNAAAAGADAVVIFNNDGGALFIGTASTTIPSAFISDVDGVALVESLSATPGLSASLSRTITIGEGQGDVMASFSSRGPNTFSGIITPSVAAPGLSVYAAYADEKPYHDGSRATPADFSFLQGTSMASPHVAGAAALVMQAQPSWNPDHVRSALMMTSTTAVLKEDGETPADALDIGSGRIQVDKAINAGLILSEVEANYLAANPAIGGDTKTLNIPSLADYNCTETCEWTRVFEVVSAGTYTITGSSSAITANPASFEGTVGQLVSVDFTFDATTASTAENNFDSVIITAAEQPDLHLPVYVVANNGVAPSDVELTVGRDNGSWLVSGLNTIATDNLHFFVDGIYDLNATGLTEVLHFDLPQDPTTGTIAGLLDIDAGGLFHYPVEVPANTSAFNVTISEATATDNDLFVMFDSNGDGAYNALVLQSASGETNEAGSISNPGEGSYLVIVQNWGASAADSDTGILTIDVVPVTDPLPGLTVVAEPVSSGAVDIRLAWDIEMEEGAAWEADITAYIGSTELTGKIGTFNVRIDRVVDDFTATANRSLLERGERIEYTLRLNSPPYQEDMDYSVAIDMPENMTILEGSVEGGGIISLNGESGFNWEVSSVVPFARYNASSSVDDASCESAALGGYVRLADFGIPTIGESIGAFGEAGDTIEIPAFANREYNHYGNPSTGMTITDDGFVYFSGGAGSSPWTNSAIPDETEQNDMIALFWKDLQVFDDGTRGIRLATNGPDMDIIEFDGLGNWGVSTDSISFELFVLRNNIFDYVVAYADTQVGNFSGAVAGVENSDGTVGTSATSLIAAGTQVCYQLEVITSDPVEVTFTVVTKPGYVGQNAAPDVTVSSSMALSTDYSFRAAPVDFVNVAPIANAGSDQTLDRSSPPTLVLMSAADSTDIDGDALIYSWEQSDGESVILSGTTADVTHFNFASAANGTYRFRVTVSDGDLSSTDEVSITISGEDKDAGDGSMGVLLLLIIAGSLFTRRRLKK